MNEAVFTNDAELLRYLDTRVRRFDWMAERYGSEKTKDVFRRIIFAAWGGVSQVGLTPFYWGLAELDLPKKNGKDVVHAQALGRLGIEVSLAIQQAPHTARLCVWVWDFLGLDRSD